jgi:hypothetical protein
MLVLAMTMDTTTLDQFLDGWIESGIEHYEHIKQRYIEFIRTGADKNAYNNANELKNLFGNKKLGCDAGRLIRNAYYCKDVVCERYTEYMKNILTKEAAKKKADLEAKIIKEVGEITNVSLMIGMDGSLNGYVEGTTGKVTVETIDAGGYNIQRYHYRVLIRKVKE